MELNNWNFGVLSAATATPTTLKCNFEITTILKVFRGLIHHTRILAPYPITIFENQN